MKKLILAFCMVALAAFNAYAEPRTYTLFLGKNNTGNETVASGTSIMIVQGQAIQRPVSATDITGLEYLEDGAAIIQVEELVVGLVPAAQGGDNSGATFSLRYRERVTSGVTWSLTNPIEVISGMALSGNSLYQIPVFPEAMGEIRWEFISGITPFDHAKIVFRILK